jgi:hypothetical protein
MHAREWETLIIFLFLFKNWHFYDKIHVNPEG